MRKLIEKLRGLINLGGGYTVDEVIEGKSFDTPRVKTRKVSSLDLHTALREQIDLSNATVLPMDTHYWVPNGRGFRKILSYHKKNAGQNVYQGDAYDCENYAIELLNTFQNRTAVNSVGLVYDGSSGHAYNIAVYDGVDGLRATLIEPNFFSMNGGEVQANGNEYTPKQSTVFL